MVIGKGSPETILTKQEVYELSAQAFLYKPMEGKRVLVIIPDHTRTAPIDIMFRVVCQLLIPRVKQLDFIIALGTHPPLSQESIYRLVGITPEDHHNKFSRVRFFNHLWNDPQQLVDIGTISGSEVAEISNGLMSRKVNVTINKIILNYDLLLIIGPTFPHEVVGFSGGNKYLFPGISGKEIIDMFHWLGALITNPVIIGRKHTPVRKVIDRAASMVPVERMYMGLVVKGKDLAGLYIGTPEEAWEAAANLSDRIHVIYKDHPYQQVLVRAPEMYEDIWTGGKCMYKLEPVVADGGELIIYAPHIREISITHGAVLEKIGYHVRDYFVKQMDRFRDIPGGVMAHSTHVKGIGKFENGVEKPRISVVLATQIPPEKCKVINLGYRDPDSIHIEQWQNREEEGILYVPKGGEILYRLKNDPFGEPQ